MGTCCGVQGTKMVSLFEFSTLTYYSQNAINIQRAYRKWKNKMKEQQNPLIISIDSQHSHELHAQISNAIDQPIKEIDHSPLNATKVERNFCEYSTIVNNLIYKIGNFNYKEYLKQLNYTEDELTLPHHEPYQLQDGTIYVRQWKLGLRHCKGRAIFLDNSIYEGFWKDDKMWGYGRLILATGDYYYESEFLRNMANWRGKQITTLGYVYEREQVNDKQQGEGIERYPDGINFKGKFVVGKKTGFEEFHFQDGSSYVGKIKEHKFNGKGVFNFGDGRKYDGQWKNNQMDDYGTFTWPDRRLYDGYYVNYKKHGFGDFTYEDGSMYKGNWFEGREH
ncbi:unnamed protein product [Paramecium primaurelia]|uniref:MORN repeat protein n=1 Tax=Paramecium primaurelia TaxID=5886 RepID=A0A8S1QFW0_PARPR|nr:unnamed protein product [Paramecium primaurelia]